MKFNVIIGNPPYQVDTGGSGRQAKPIYNVFVEMAISMNPKYVVMITPSRWFSGGMGLNNFRNKMMTDRRIMKMVDFPNSKDCFPGVSISGGVNYFLWNRDYKSKCYFTSIKNGISESSQIYLDQHRVIVRHDIARNIIDKILSKKEKMTNDVVSPINVFSIPSSFRGNKKTDFGYLKVKHSKGDGYIHLSALRSGQSILNKYKVVVSRTIAEHANEPSKDGKYKVLAKVFVLEPGEICTHSYLVINTTTDKNDAESFACYLRTKFARFLILQTISGIDLSAERFMFLPIVDYLKLGNDTALYKKFNLIDEEINFIESTIKSME